MRYFNNEVYFYTNPFISIPIPKSCPITIYGIVATFKIILIFLFIRDYLIILYRGGIYIYVFLV